MNDAATTEVSPLVVTTQTYRVPAENMPVLADKVAKISRKAVKLGCSPILLNTVSELDVPFLRIERDLDGHLDGDNERYRYTELDTAEKLADAKAKVAKTETGFHAGRYTIVYRKYLMIELTGAVPRLAGWDFVATLQHLEVDGDVANMLRIVPGFEGNLPVKFRNCGPENCDHCKKTIRTRKETFVVRNVETSEWMQVGRNCTQDFLGGKDPHAVAKMLEYLQTAGDLCGGAEEGMGSSRIEERAELGNFLTWVAACVRVTGWVSRGQARAADGRVEATADKAFMFINPPDFRGDSKGLAKYLAEKLAHTPTAEDEDLAAKAIEYAHEDLEGKMAGNDYLYNLWVACNQVSLNRKLIGIAASLISHYIKEVQRQVLREVEARRVGNSTHVGTIGAREFFKVTVLDVKVVGADSPFGPKNLHKMVDTAGNLIIWFDSGSGDNLKTGQEYILKATVKKHDEFRGVKQTIINRADVYTQELMDVELAKAAKKAERAAKKAAKLAAQKPVDGNDEN